GRSYTPGLLATNQKLRVEADVEKAVMDRSEWTRRIVEEGYATIAADPALMRIVRETGHRLFLDNCAACHGQTAGGGPGFPALTDKAWLWGGTAAAIAETIRVGVNSAHEDSRVSEMLAFGRDRMLPRDDILKVVDYVRSLSLPDARNALLPVAREAGKTVFLENCAACHGEDAKGNIETGAPNLTDDHWIYGGDRETVFETVWSGRKGHMPTWERRLPEVDRKILTLYLLDLEKEAALQTDTKGDGHGG
ncbi:MAG: cytochrome-c oxidase, cbb3-type subunit III, partial [Alphaproteobacteria bacterium]